MMRLVVEYDPIERTVAVKENEFTTFELLGVLEAVKGMAFDDWLRKDDKDE